MRWVWLIVAIVACSKSQRMAPIPNATVEKWSATLDAVCESKTFEPRKATPDNPIAAYQQDYRCTPLEVLEHRDGERPPFFFGGFLQFDGDGRVSRIELEMLTSEARAVDALRRVLVHYGLPVELVVEKFPNVSGRTRYEDLFVYEGASISVQRHTGYTSVVNISIQAP
jgi:hypothetical protein